MRDTVYSMLAAIKKLLSERVGLWQPVLYLCDTCNLRTFLWNYRKYQSLNGTGNNCNDLAHCHEYAYYKVYPFADKVGRFTGGAAILGCMVTANAALSLEGQLFYILASYYSRLFDYTSGSCG